MFSGYGRCRRQFFLHRWRQGKGRHFRRHFGRGGHFVVVESHNAKVRAGDTFQCAGFTLSEPLYVTHLVHDGQTSDLFVMGKKGGLTSVKVM